MMHNKAFTTFLLGASLLISVPSACLASRTRAAARRRLSSLQKKNARHRGGNAHNKKRGRTCARDSAIEVLLHAELAVLDIPFDVEEPRVLERYVNDVRDCAMSFLQNLMCATIEEDINKGRTVFSPQIDDMKGRIMEEGGNTDGRIVITPEQCCCDADAIRDMAAASIRNIERSWAPDVDGTYDVAGLQRKVEFGVFDGTKKRFADALVTVGGIYIRQLGNKLDPVCFPPGKGQNTVNTVDATKETPRPNEHNPTEPCFACSSLRETCRPGRGLYNLRHCDETMFIQCDNSGKCSEHNCERGLVWNPSAGTEGVGACVLPEYS